MATRIAIRRVGDTTGKKVGLPGSFAELLLIATSKLGLASPASRVFAADGDEYDADDFELISMSMETVSVTAVEVCGECRCD